MGQSGILGPHLLHSRKRTCGGRAGAKACRTRQIDFESVRFDPRAGYETDPNRSKQNQWVM